MNIDKLYRFSIITPAHNAGKYIEKCLNSILMQSFKNYEILLVNDNSEDSTMYKAIKFKEEHFGFNIKFLNTKDTRGAGSARNVALKEAKGEYIIFVDADDYITSLHALEILNDELEKQNNPDVMVSGSMANYKNYKEKTRKVMIEKPKKKEENKRFQLSKKIYRFIWPLCIKRELIQSNDITFPESINMYEDVIFRTYVMSVAKDIKVNDNILYNYNRRTDLPESASLNIKDGYLSRLKDLKKANTILDEMVDNGKIPEEYVKDFKRTKLLRFPGYVIVTYNHICQKIKKPFIERNINRYKDEEEIQK